MKKESIHEIFTAIPTLKLERVTLRALHPIDAEDMFDYAKRDDVTRFLLWSPHPDLNYTKQYLTYIHDRYTLGDFYDWAIIERESRRMIGTAGFAKIDAANRWAEIGYVLHPDFHGRGYGTEVARAVVAFGFEELGLHRISARFMQGNAPSLRVMEKLGMTFEGYRRDAMLVKGKYRTIGYCSLIYEEWIKQNDK